MFSFTLNSEKISVWLVKYSKDVDLNDVWLYLTAKIDGLPLITFPPEEACPYMVPPCPLSAGATGALRIIKQAPEMGFPPDFFPV